MSLDLLAEVVSTLRAQNVPFALIGAAAMAAHGVSRSTYDTDLLVVSPVCLERDLWRGLEASGVGVDVRAGDDDDPLLGVVRCSRGDQAIDIVIGRGAWQRGVIDRAKGVSVFGLDLPVVTASDLVVLKLYAGGLQDRWDIQQLLLLDRAAVSLDDVDARVQALPSRSQALWRELRDVARRERR